MQRLRRGTKGSGSSSKVAALGRSGSGGSKLALASSAASLASIPLRLDVVNKLCSHLSVHFLQKQGLFRVPGKHTDVQALYNTFDLPVSEIPLDQFGEHVVASALKKYLDDQPEPIVPASAFQPLLASYETATAAKDMPCTCDSVEVCECVRRHVHAMVATLQESMPAENKPVFRALWDLMGGFVKHVTVNQMTPENLGVCLGPVLFRSPLLDPRAAAESYKQSADMLALLVHNFDIVLNAFPLGHSSYNVFSPPPPFADSDWALLASTATIHRHVKGEVVWEANTENTKLYRISKGTYAVKKPDGSVITELGRHQVLGEMSFLGRRRTSAQVVCSEDDSEIVEMDTHLVNAMLEADPELMLRFYFMLSRKLAERLIDTNATEVFKHSTSSQRLGSTPSATDLKKLLDDSSADTEYRQNLSSLLRIICDADLRPLFATFLKSRYSSELLDFWIEVEAYQTCRAPEERKERARALYRTYIMPGAAKELCISDRNVVKRIETDLDSLRDDLFDAARVICGEMMVTDHLGKFLPSKLWLDRDKGEEVWYLPGGQALTIRFNLEDTIEALLASEAVKSKASEKEVHLFFVTSSGARQFDKKQKYAHVRKTVADMDGRFIVSRYEPPSSALHSSSGAKSRKQVSNTVLKEYDCKYGKRSGTLYVSPGYVAHFSRKLGLEQKKIIHFAQITDIVWDEALVITITVGSEEKHLTFKASPICGEAYRIMHTVWKKQTAEQEGEDNDGEATPRSCAEDNFGRVLITMDFKSPSPTFLDVQKGDILLATNVSELGGEKIIFLTKNDQSGWVPVRYTEKLFDVDTTKELESRGYHRCAHLPTREEWHLLLLGGREERYKAGEVILRVEGGKQSIYHIVEGRAAVRAPQGLQLAVLKQDEVFGEISVLLGGGARAEVIAGSGKERTRRRTRRPSVRDMEAGDNSEGGVSGAVTEQQVPEGESEADEETVVFEIAAPFLSRVCREHPLAAAHFFKYIATVVETRLRIHSLK